MPGIHRTVAAMRYSALAGGKRLRPFLVVHSAALFDVPETTAMPVAAAIECVHCYSLVHDDLPAMDDDDLRRGRPTVHIAYDEATAILAGDGLLTHAFEILSRRTDDISPAARLELVASLASAAGAKGMIGGQMRDIEAENQTLDLNEITQLQRLKTGALIEWSALAGPVMANAGPDDRQALSDYAQKMGLVFQITDDLLDHQGDSALVGKTVGKDADAGKGTFVAHLGPDGARQRAQELTDRAVASLARFGAKAGTLQQLARFVLMRKK
ncbi:MAG: polyprenyl synthetase family protein [Pseudomonadota bacterium]